MGVHDALGVTRRPRGEGHDRRCVRVDGQRVLQGIAVQQRVERDGPAGQLGVRRVPHHQPPWLGRAAEEGPVDLQVVGVAEVVGGDHHVGRGRSQDVVDLLGPVEVHDRYHGGTEVGGGPEGDARLGPVRQLDHDDVTGADPRGPVDVTERPPPRADLGAHVEGLVTTAAESPGDQCAERGVVPPPLSAVLPGQCVGHRTQSPPLRHGPAPLPHDRPP